MSSKRSVPVALTIAGSDCSSGAGLQADLKTFTAFGVFGLTAVTCVVAEVPGKVFRIDAVDRANLSRQIELCLAHFPVTAIKTGLLFSAENVGVVADLLERLTPAIPVVVDPVMSRDERRYLAATGGDGALSKATVCRERASSLRTSRKRPFSLIGTVCNLERNARRRSRAREKNLERES